MEETTSHSTKDIAGNTVTTHTDGGGTTTGESRATTEVSGNSAMEHRDADGNTTSVTHTTTEISGNHGTTESEGAAGVKD